MSDVRLFAGSEGYDNHWDSDLIDNIDGKKNWDKKALEESCFSDPCRIYLRGNTESLLDAGRPVNQQHIGV